MTALAMVLEPAAVPAALPLSVDALAAALRDETRLLGELGTIVRRQREGVAREDVEAVDDSVFAAHRLLRTIGEARRRRRSLLEVLTGAGDVGIHELDSALGARMSAALRAARDELYATANALSREIALNRRILQEALRAGDEYMRTLCGAPSQSAVYDAGARPAGEMQQSGLLLNRQV